MAWSNPVVKRIAAGDRCEGEFNGLLLAASWPMPAAVQAQYEAFRATLCATLPEGAYCYPASTLHCTVATLRAFTGGPLDATSLDAAHTRWLPVLDMARSSSEWPTGSFKVRMGTPTLEGAAGIFRYEDVDGAIEKMRACLREAIVAHGGLAAEGGGDRSKAKPIAGTPAGEPAPHIPDIVHSTAVRWASEPPDRAKAKAAFDKAAATWAPIEIVVTGAAAVDETAPYMHIPLTSTAWWRSERGGALWVWVRTAAEALLTLLLPFVLTLIAIKFGRMPGKGGRGRHGDE